MREQGTISITAENMFPIIRKWLYADRDIFIRELVSNGSDAIAKLAGLAGVGQADVPADESWRIIVEVDEENKTIAFDDNGIGMTADEVRKYINQVAFSGAKDFFEQYKDSAPDAQIIGHFGLGFYSSFMAAKSVRIDTLSFREGAEPVTWESQTGTEFTITEGTRTQRGSRMTLELDDDNAEFASLYAVREVLMKYFRYLPTPIYLRKAGEEVKEDEKPINAKAPLWVKSPADCTEDEYKSFYREVFPMAAEPLFWVHLNIDYPFRLKGILYFPKLRSEFESAEGQVKLYCNQVFVADNLKEVIPEYLLLLKGCIDCPDLPLNVSRSALQNDSTVKKISAHITRKVADRVVSLFKDERETFEKVWDDVSPFIKYGCLRDEKFYDRVKSALIFKLPDGSYQTVDEYIEAVPEVEIPHECTCGEGEECSCGHEHEAHKEKTVYYVSDPRQQAQYLAMFKEKGLSAVILDHALDNHFITLLERKSENLRFRRIDSSLEDLTGEKSGAELDAEGLKAGFAGVAPGVTVELAALSAGAAPAVMVLSEEGRRLQEMAKMFGQDPGMFPSEKKLVINENHPLIGKLDKMLKAGKFGDAAELTEQVYDLARIAHEPLSAEDMTKFIARSVEILKKLAD